jgi:hypothetical protein
MTDLWKKKYFLPLEKEKKLSSGFWGDFHPWLTFDCTFLHAQSRDFASQ